MITLSLFQTGLLLVAVALLCSVSALVGWVLGVDWERQRRR